MSALRPVLITGGAGFIGANLAHRLLAAGEPVTILDNLSRPGVRRNLDWLRQQHGGSLEIVVGDVRDRSLVEQAVRGSAAVFHLAAQVAVTTSLSDPRQDFDVNAVGTLNVLEAMRRSPDPPPLLYTSTNKVYGGLGDLALIVRDGRYEPAAAEARANGIGEQRALDFHSPYGCSKGCADQYVLDHARSFGLRTVVFRMSCIYGPRQMGTEDQGWVAHFVLQALRGAPVMVYGDGMQVRDMLFIDDLLDAMLLARQHIGLVAGQVFNVGGGPDNAVSLLEVLDLIAGMNDRPQVSFGPWRVGDQRWYVTDTRKIARMLGWSPHVGVSEGIGRLNAWLLGEVEAERPGGEQAMVGA